MKKLKYYFFLFLLVSWFPFEVFYKKVNGHHSFIWGWFYNYFGDLL